MLTKYDDPYLYDVRTGSVKLTKDYAPKFWETQSQDRSWRDGALPEYVFIVFGHEAFGMLRKINRNDLNGFRDLITYRDHYDNTTGQLVPRGC
jgi:hypothetical protein